MITIDSKQIVYSATFLVATGVESYLDIPIDDSRLLLSIKFVTSTGSAERTGEWQEENGIVRFVFTGWNNPLGTCVLEPTKFGDIDGKKIYFQLAHYLIGEQNLVHIFILRGI
ncbi:DUF6864 domain-containing function [Synechococcus elongatus]|uniref:DUF6864 domain-containing function n=1 Tax=Synechococcus elongatus TaxID=32046 RepID=UPI003CC8513B